jgi:hypothetical protein
METAEFLDKVLGEGRVLLELRELLGMIEKGHNTL